MKPRIIALVLLISLLCGCSAAGTYNFQCMEADGITYDAASVEDPEGCYVKLLDDGSGILSIFGEAILIGWEEGKLWPASDPSDAIEFQLSGSTLILEYEGQKLIFSK